MWKNKHVVVALLVAPGLALIAYFGVDALVSQDPQAAVDGQAYPLRASSNCRYVSGECELRNGDVVVRLRLLDDFTWELDSDLTLRGALLSRSDDAPPVRFVPLGNDSLRWQATLPSVKQSDTLRLVIVVADSQYYATIPAIFIADSP